MSDTLPPLPEPIIKESCPDGDYEGYTADQMRAYALAARQQARVPEQVRRDLLTELMDHAFNDGRQGLDSPSAATREAEQRFRAAMLAAAGGGQAAAVPHGKKQFDPGSFAKAFEEAVERSGQTMKQVSVSTGVSETTLSRMVNRTRVPDAASLAALSAWAGINPAKHMKPAESDVPVQDTK